MVSASETPPPDLVRPAALAAFLRGVERRAAVLAELQAGDPTLGDAALTRAMAAFREVAVDAPMADWPRLFWQALLAQPALRRATRARPAAFMPRCSPALRAAMLLRLAAGLEEAAAAAVLDVPPPRLREAVLRALPTAPEGVPDAGAWQRLQADVQQRVRGLPTERSLRLARMREGALAGPAARFFVAPTGWQRHRLQAAGAAAALTVLALAATWRAPADADGPVAVEALRPAGSPASRYSKVTGLLTHPDFDLLADPAEARLARDAAFLAWTVGRNAVPVAPTIDDIHAPSVPETAEASDAP
ncbi:hypothetical protein [Cognatilysobacter segetis]|uniref:hypothetical protein n=1 Tax=Cognatilysobacter segetis TaxID=2492394 RepID=UPI001061ECD3|nr:hypothetical protein [Lysobacter segetis]